MTIHSTHGECPFCRETDELVVIRISQGTWPNREWVDSTLRRCANDECWTIREGSNEDRLSFISDQEGYKYFGDYQLSEAQREAISQSSQLAAKVPVLLAALKNLTESIEHAWPALAHLGPLVEARDAIAHGTPEDR